MLVDLLGKTNNPVSANRVGKRKTKKVKASCTNIKQELCCFDENFSFLGCFDSISVCCCSCVLALTVILENRKWVSFPLFLLFCNYSTVYGCFYHLTQLYIASRTSRPLQPLVFPQPVHHSHLLCLLSMRTAVAPPVLTHAWRLSTYAGTHAQIYNPEAHDGVVQSPNAKRGCDA